MDAYYTPEQMRQFETAGKAMPQAEIEAIEQGWTAFLAEVRANYERGAFEGNLQAPQAADFAFFERVKAARAEAGDADSD